MTVHCTPGSWNNSQWPGSGCTCNNVLNRPGPRSVSEEPGRRRADRPTDGTRPGGDDGGDDGRAGPVLARGAPRCRRAADVVAPLRFLPSWPASGRLPWRDVVPRGEGGARPRGQTTRLRRDGVDGARSGEDGVARLPSRPVVVASPLCRAASWTHGVMHPPAPGRGGVDTCKRDPTLRRLPLC